MAQPVCPSTSFPHPALQLHPFPWELPRVYLVRLSLGTTLGCNLGSQAPLAFPKPFADPSPVVRLLAQP